MARSKVLADLSNVDFLFDSSHMINKIEAREGYCFINENVENSKPIFVISKDIDGSRCQELITNKAYEFAISSAVINLCGKIIDSRSEKQEEKQPEQRIKEVDAAINKFKEEEADNPKFITSKLVMQPATRYYSGKQGTNIAKIAGLDKLKDEEIAAISIFYSGNKDNAAKAIKEAKSDGWFKERLDYTPEGWRQIQTIKYETLHKIGKIEQEAYVKKMQWIEEFDFHPGWNYESKIAEEVESVDIDDLSENSIVVLTEFNKEFVLNAINKDSILDEC